MMEAGSRVGACGKRISGQVLIPGMADRLLGGDSTRNAEYQVNVNLFFSLSSRQPMASTSCQSIPIIPATQPHVSNLSLEKARQRNPFLSFPRRRKKLILYNNMQVHSCTLYPICSGSEGKQIECDRSSLAGVECL